MIWTLLDNRDNQDEDDDMILAGPGRSTDGHYKHITNIYIIAILLS
jgi:hypothetical protein